MDKSPLSYTVGIDIGGTNIKAVAINSFGEIDVRKTVATGKGREDWSRSLRTMLSDLRTTLKRSPSSVCIAAPGLPSRDFRSIAWMRGRLQDLEGLDWQDLLGMPTAVPVINDAHAAVIGEAWIGAAVGCANVLMLTLGTGVGGGAIVNGRILQGHLGRAGHVGHITVSSDSVQDIVNTPGSLESAFGECTLLHRSNGRFSTTKDLIEASDRGDQEALNCWHRSVDELAIGIASLVNVLDPEIVVLGGGVALAGSALFDPLQAKLKSIEWRPFGSGVRIAPAQLGEWAGAIGACRSMESETINLC